MKRLVRQFLERKRLLWRHWERRGPQFSAYVTSLICEPLAVLRTLLACGVMLLVYHASSILDATEGVGSAGPPIFRKECIGQVR